MDIGISTCVVVVVVVVVVPSFGLADDAVEVVKTSAYLL
jgi:hypothetical protein